MIFSRTTVDDDPDEVHQTRDWRDLEEEEEGRGEVEATWSMPTKKGGGAGFLLRQWSELKRGGKPEQKDRFSTTRPRMPSKTVSHVTCIGAERRMTLSIS